MGGTNLEAILAVRDATTRRVTPPAASPRSRRSTISTPSASTPSSAWPSTPARWILRRLNSGTEIRLRTRGLGARRLNVWSSIPSKASMRNSCRRLRCPCACGACPRGAARRFDDTEHINRTIQLEPGGTLRLKNFSGRVTITGIGPAGGRRSTPSAAARVTAGPHQARHPHRRLERRGRGRQPARPFLVGLRQRQQRRRDRLRHQGAAPDQPRLSVFSSPVTSTASKARTRLHGFSSPLRPQRRHRPDPGPYLQRVASSIREKSWEPDQIDRRRHLQRQRRAARPRLGARHASPSTRSAAA